MRIFSLLLCWTCAGQDPELLQRGAEAMRAGRFSQAAEIYRKLLASSPKDPRLHLNLGLALVSDRKFEAADRELEVYLQANPSPGPVHLMSGTTKLKLHKPCDAIAPLEKARQWQVTGAVLVELGDAYNGCKRYLDAAKTYEQAAREKKGDVKVERAAAQAYWEAREYPIARTIYTKLERNFDRDPQFLYEYGDTLVRLEGASAGLSHLEKAVALQSSLLPARAAYGKALLEVGRAQEAIPHLEAAGSVDASVWLALSKSYQTVGRKDDAAKALAEYRKRMTDGAR